MSELPKGWKTATIEELIDPQRKMSYGVLKPGPHVDDGVRLLKSNQVNHGTLDLTNDYRISQRLSDEYKRTILQGGELLLNVVGSIGRTAIAPPDVAGANVSRAIAVLPIPQDFVRWVHHYFSSPQAQSEMFDRKTGIAQPVLNLGQVKQMEVPLPPLPEQRRIVARIEELFSRLDAGVAALRHAKAQLQRYRQSVLAAAVTGQLTQAWREQHPDTEPAEELLKRILVRRRQKWNGRRKYSEPIVPAVTGLPEIPESWTWSSPAQLSAPEDYSLAIGPFGSNLKVSDYTDEGVPLVFVRHIRANDYNLSQKFVSPEKAAELKAHSIDPGDLLITKMGEPPGDAALYPENRPHAIISADCIKLRLSELIASKSFFVNAINSQLVAKQIAPITRGVAQKKISLDRFRDIALPLPPLAEQHQIVTEVEARTTAIDHLEAELDRQITRSNRLRQSVLCDAFSGRLSA